MLTTEISNPIRAVRVLRDTINFKIHMGFKAGAPTNKRHTFAGFFSKRESGFDWEGKRRKQRGGKREKGRRAQMMIF